MNRIATPSRRRSLPSSAVVFDLSDEAQKRVHGLIQRFHTGRWPLFRCLGMQQVNGVIFEAVQWLRIEPPQLAVVRYEPDGLGLSWRRYNSSKAALAALSEANQTT